MKIIRLILLTMMLMGSFYMYDRPVSACVDESSAACPPNAPRDNGCKCCSDNHCKSNYCNPANNKCAKHPNDTELPEDPPEN